MKRIAFIYNSVSDAKRRGMLVECAPRHTVTAIEHALVQGGYELIPINLHSRDQLEGIFGELGKPDFAFCIAEGFLAEPQTLFNGFGAALVRQVLTELNVPFSHSSVAAMELCRYKDRTYHALQAHGVCCPWHLHLFAQDLLLDLDCRLFPLFVKPAGGGNSVGIDAGSVVNSQEQLARRILSLHHSLGPINLIVEKFLPGSEYTVGVIGNAKPVVLPPIRYTYEIANPIQAIENLTATTLRNIIGELDLDATLTSRDIINTKMRATLDEATDKWGIKINRVELKNIMPPNQIVEAMEKQMRAERERREAILRAEGEKRSAVLKAEGEKEANILQAEGEREAMVRRAKGEAESILLVQQAKADGIKSVFSAIKDMEPTQEVINVRALEALEKIADGQATKLVVPTEVAGILGSLQFLGLKDK